MSWARPGPTLFIWGSADPVCGPVLSGIRDRVPGAHITMLDEGPATGHHPQIENPSAVLAVRAPFLWGAGPSRAVSRKRSERSRRSAYPESHS